MVGGWARAERDTAGCHRIRPSPAFRAWYVMDNPPDTVSTDWTGFVRGYLHSPPEAVCGEARVFHLLTRN